MIRATTSLSFGWSQYDFNHALNITEHFNDCQKDSKKICKNYYIPGLIARFRYEGLGRVQHFGAI